MRILLYLLLMLALASCYQVERNCSDFKTGAYFSEVAMDDMVFVSSFYRNDTLQVETYQGKTDSARVRWINDCEVVFKTINPKSMAERKDIHLKILTTTDSSYTFEYSYVGESLKQQGIAYKSD